MKKIYTMPAVTVINVQTANIMETSQMEVGSTVNSVQGDSRRGGGWDED